MSERKNSISKVVDTISPGECNSWSYSAVNGLIQRIQAEINFYTFWTSNYYSFILFYIFLCYCTILFNFCSQKIWSSFTREGRQRINRRPNSTCLSNLWPDHSSAWSLLKGYQEDKERNFWYNTVIWHFIHYFTCFYLFFTHGCKLFWNV